MLGDPFQRGPCQVQTVKARVVAFQRRHDPQRLSVVVKPSVRLHQKIKRIFAGVSERRVAQIMGQGDSFGDVRVQPQGIRDGTRNLRHLDRMGQPCAIKIAFVFHKDLRFVL